MRCGRLRCKGWRERISSSQSVKSCMTEWKTRFANASVFSSESFVLHRTKIRDHGVNFGWFRLRVFLLAVVVLLLLLLLIIRRVCDIRRSVRVVFSVESFG